MHRGVKYKILKTINIGINLDKVIQFLRLLLDVVKGVAKAQIR